MTKILDIEFKGIPLTIRGIYQEGEAGVMYYEDSLGIPPTASNFDVSAIYVGNGADVYDLYSIDIYDLFSVSDIEQISEECINYIEER